MTSVLVVDDEPGLLRALAINLTARGYSVQVARNGGEALQHVARSRPDLVVLDLGLPDMDGTAVVHGLRGWTTVPILVLSGRSGSRDKVEALDAGADDYVTKPFSLEELLARLRAMHRRVPLGEEEPVVSMGPVTVDLALRRVTRQGSDVHLTPTEWDLLEALVRSPGKLLSRQQLLTQVWGPGYEDADGSLRLYMSQLRHKLEEDPRRPRFLLNEPGLGYRFKPAGDDA
jgi:two-component system KDP operon response regulator KdpE